MSVWVAYLLVILVWSTSPLAIAWSSESLGAMTALSLRLMISVVLIVGLRPIVRCQPFAVTRNWRAYLSGSMGLFPAMALVYWAADYLPSSLISVLFGLAPFVVVLLNLVMSRVSLVSKGQIGGMVLAFVGLLVVMLPREGFQSVSVWGVILLLSAVLFYALSTILVKRYTQDVDVTNQLLGTVVFASPFFLIAWVCEMGGVSGMQAIFDDVDARAVYATLYLAVMGSVVGFFSYFYLLKRISAAAVSLITMITPAMALVLGVWLNAEVFSAYIYFGITCIMLGLWLFRYSEGATVAEA